MNSFSFKINHIYSDEDYLHTDDNSAQVVFFRFEYIHIEGMYSKANGLASAIKE